MMDQDFKAKWMEALRSGRYRQGKGSLRTRCADNAVAYCCLGVACNLINDRGWSEDESRYSAWGNCPPYSLRLFFIDIGHAGVLARMNDSGSSFAEIADWIESHDI